MFDLLSARVVDNEKVVLNRPDELYIQIKGEDKASFFNIEKGANKFLYKELGLSSSASKEIFKIDENIWRNLINFLIEPKDGIPSPFNFNKENVRYISDSVNNLIDMTICNDESCEVLKEKMDKFIMEVSSIEHTKKFYIEGTGGLIKLVIYRADADISGADYTPVVILEINNKKAEYFIYTGILVYKNFITFIPSMNPVSSYKSYIDFVMNVNILGTLELSESSANDLYNAYLEFKSGHIEISARELIRILSKVGCKLELKEDLSLDDIDKLKDEESNTAIKNFFNSFKMSTGETAEDILNLSEVKKIFRYNKLTIVDLLEILSKEYLQDDGAKITAQILSDLVFGLYTRRTDVIDAKGIIDDISNR